jgi:hypothetical protein
VTLVSELDTKRQGLSDMSNESYNIYCKGKKIYSHLTQEEYFDIMEDLSVEFYQTGTPSPNDLETKIISENHYGYS